MKNFNSCENHTPFQSLQIYRQNCYRPKTTLSTGVKSNHCCCCHSRADASIYVKRSALLKNLVAITIKYKIFKIPRTNPFSILTRSHKTQVISLGRKEFSECVKTIDCNVSQHCSMDTFCSIYKTTARTTLYYRLPYQIRQSVA